MNETYIYLSGRPHKSQECDQELSTYCYLLCTMNSRMSDNFLLLDDDNQFLQAKKFSITLTQSGMPSKHYESTDGHS